MEIVIALSIIGILSISMLGVIRDTVRVAAETESLRRESDQINRMIESCRKTFTTMPATATLALKIVQTTEPIIQELTITGSPDCFPFGPNPISYKDTILRLRPHPDGLIDANQLPIHYFSLSREDLIPKTDSAVAIRQSTTGLYAPDDQSRYWMPLLPDVVTFKWRCYVEKEDTWYEEWSKSQWPDLIELTFTLKDRTTPTRMVFGLPVITIAAGRAPAPSAPSASSSTSQSSAPTGGGGGRGGGGGQSSDNPQPPKPDRPMP